MSIGERVKLARESAGLTQSELCRRIAMKQPSLSELERGMSKTTSHVLEIAKACGVNPYWLQTGAGDMRRTGLIQSVMPIDENIEELPSEVSIPMYREVALSAGAGLTEVIEDTNNVVRIQRSKLTGRGLDLSCLAACKVSGDSMEKIMPHGTEVVIDTSARIVEDGKIYAFSLNGMLRVKYLYRQQDGSIRVESENKSYPVEIISLSVDSDFHIIGRVVLYTVST